LSTKLKLNSLDGLEVLKSGLSAHQFPLHYHDTFCVSLIYSGLLGENNVIAPANHLLVSHPFEIHKNEIIHSNNYSLTTFYISDDVFKSVGAGEYISFDQKVIHDANLFQIFSQLSDLVFSGDISDKRNFDLKFIQSIKQLTRKYASSRPYCETTTPALLNSIKQYILDNIDKKIVLDDLSKMAGKDKYQFIRWFKKHVGLTPFHFVNLHRVEKSKQMIKQGKPLVHTALDAGFYDQSHFTNYFKYFVGITPKEYQQQCNIFQDFQE
jgi:AraC-like DNA-binding protein